ISSLLTRFLFLDHRYDLFVRKSCLHLSVLLLGGLYTNLEELKGRRSVGDVFFKKLGSTVGEKTLCASGSSTAWLKTVGPSGGVDPESFAHSKYIVLWSVNTMTTNLHDWPIIQEAQNNGAKVVVIDKFSTRTPKLQTYISDQDPGSMPRSPWE
ncbi:MAG: hypothetical protein ABJ360_19450, partial [Roseobacter sp.]